MQSLNKALNPLLERHEKCMKKFVCDFKRKHTWTIWKLLKSRRYSLEHVLKIKLWKSRFQSPIGCAQFVTKILQKMDQLLLKPLAAIVFISEFLCKNKIKVLKMAFLTYFFRQCIKKWLQLKNVCPLCHRKVFKVLWKFDFSNFFRTFFKN